MNGCLKIIWKSKEKRGSLLETVHIFSEDIGMHFCLYKDATLKIEGGKIVKEDWLEANECKCHETIDIRRRFIKDWWEASDLLHEQVKKNTNFDYIKQILKIENKIKRGEYN